MKTNVTDTSIEAYHSNPEKLTKYRKQILELVERNGSLCNLDISDRAGIPINTVTGAVFWLREKGFLVFDRKDICKQTEMRVNYWITKTQKGEQTREDNSGNPTLFSSLEVPAKTERRTYGQNERTGKPWAH